MSWLTRIRLSGSQAAAAGLVDSYAWHQAVWKMFPGKDGQDRDFLMRIDRKPFGFEALVLSPDEPRRPEWISDMRWEAPKQVLESFLDHERYMFDLRANPTIKRVIRDADGNRKKNGQRTTICDPVELGKWLDRKAETSGFSVEMSEASPPVKNSFVKSENGKKKKGVHASVDFRGVLRVVDRELFKNAFVNGIGPARAFGFGMLMLRPVQ